MSRRVLTSLGPGLLMLVIGLIGAGRPVLSWDEIATADVATRTPGQIWHLIQHVDAVFGPYYFLEHFWTSVFGHSATSLRLPSILAMAGAAALVGTLGRRYFGTPTGVVAGVLFCLLPSTSRYAAEARPYAFACFSSLLALFLLHRALERPAAWRWVAYAAGVAFIGFSHLIALTTLAAHLVVIWRNGSRRTAVIWIAAVAAGLAALTPVLWLGMHQRGDQLWWVPPLSPQVLWNFPGEIAGSVAAGWLVVGLAVVGLCRPLAERWVPAALMFGPLVTVGLVSALVTPYWVARYLLVVLAPLTLLAAAGLRDVLFVAARVATVRIPSQRKPEAVSPELVGSASAATSGSGRALPDAPATPPADEPPPPPSPPPAGRRSWPYAATALRIAAVLAVLAFAVSPGQEAVRGLHAKAGNDYRTAAGIIRKDQLPGDSIIYTANNRTMRAGLSFYLHQKPTDVLSIKTGAANGQLHDTETAPTRARLAGTSRLWVFLDGRHKNPIYGRLDLAAPIKGQFHLDHVWYPQNATLALYVRDRA